MLDMAEMLIFKDVGLILYMIKTFFICIYTYQLALRLINIKITKKNKVRIVLLVCCIIVLCEITKYLVNTSISIIFMNISLTLIFSYCTKNKVGESFLIISISLSLNYILLIISLIISFQINELINIENDLINLSIIIIIYTICKNKFLKIKKIQNGFLFLIQKVDDEYLDILILNISIIILFSYIILTGVNNTINKSIFLGFIFFSIMMFITIQKSLQLYYKQRLVMQDLEQTKEDLKYKKIEVKELEKEILNFNKMKHSILHKQKALEFRIKELKLNNETSEEINVEEQLRKLRKEITGNKIQIEIQKTGIEIIDNMLKYMQSECTKREIEFELQINGNIHQMVNNYISKEKLEILIADHIKNAIIAITHSENKYKNILVRIGKIDGYFSLYIYDTGKEFEKETLQKIGKEPITTYKDEGGSGMGFMNTFDTLKENKASMIINEIGKPSEDNYTKIIKIKFNNKNEFKIDSYRGNT